MYMYTYVYIHICVYTYIYVCIYISFLIFWCYLWANILPSFVNNPVSMRCLYWSALTPSLVVEYANTNALSSCVCDPELCIHHTCSIYDVVMNTTGQCISFQVSGTQCWGVCGSLRVLPESFYFPTETQGQKNFLKLTYLDIAKPRC